MTFSSFLTNATTIEALTDMSINLKGAALDDVAVLGLVLLGGAGYLLRGIAWDKPDPYHHIWFQRPQELESNGQKLKETRNIAQKLEESGKNIVIFWGSQSGTAEGFANRLARECHLRFGLSTMAADLSDYDSETIVLIPNTKLAIFIMSTYGEGDPSDNAGGLWDWIGSSTDTNLPNLRYSAFGLGNKNYKYYNRVIDVVSESLDKFGATALLPVGRADDSNGSTEEDFMDWKATLFSVFRTTLNYTEREVTYEPTLSVILGDEDASTADLHLGTPIQSKENQKGYSQVHTLPLKTTRELFTSSTRNCLHIDLDLSTHPELKYRTGDHLAIYPTNPAIEVTRLLKVLNLTSSASIPVTISSLDATQKTKLPSPTTPTALFTHYLEICAPLSRDTIAALALFSPTPAAKLFLTHLGSSKEAYGDFLSRTHITLGRLLEIALTTCTPGCEDPCPETWTGLPLSFILEVLPPMSPRYYSISSSPLLTPRTASITAIVSQTPLPANPSESIPGLATNNLLNLHTSSLPSPTVQAQIRTSRFRAPFSPATPLLLVAAGTGLAPFRAFLTERARLRQMGKVTGRVVLFFGCRDPDEDYIYKEELAQVHEALGEEGMKIVTAFSRVSGQSKVYVQDRLRECGGEVGELLTGEEGCGFYICGAAAMAREVGKVVGSVIGEKNGWDEAKVGEWVAGMKRGRRWQEDVWG